MQVLLSLSAHARNALIAMETRQKELNVFCRLPNTQECMDLLNAAFKDAVLLVNYVKTSDAINSLWDYAHRMYSEIKFDHLEQEGDSLNDYRMDYMFGDGLPPHVNEDLKVTLIVLNVVHEIAMRELQPYINYHLKNAFDSTSSRSMTYDVWGVTRIGAMLILINEGDYRILKYHLDQLVTGDE